MLKKTRSAVAVPTLRPPLPVAPTLKRLGVAIRSMELPAIEKIAEELMGDAFQVLISTMLSAQTKDPVTLAASLRLFAVAADPAALARLPLARIETLIYPVSFYRNKAVHLKETARILVKDFGGQVPTTMEALLTLPGVGRKTANLTLIVACRSQDNICVDTHVHRIANRFGWVRTRTPEQTERALYEVAPRRWWATINLHLVTWGQHVCKPVFPQCGRCILNGTCPKLGVVREGRVA
ncbi:endonuclease III [Luteitalea sp.]|uniref:endonuclease III domain-containing protein n=1 Tax=Luteitalea sp. TaxID=2004800 RepID=UPI000A79344F|nr:endonuclease III [Luteitalea sp.]